MGLCLKIGMSKQVAIRRDIVDVMKLLEYKVEKSEKNRVITMLSGRLREGFRLENSEMNS